ncbi:hypothetical protein DHEL01_v212607 [Diaporthe helianthi]|uniref:Uncharacterized protein n=1 Tax=Diaporthe helianthi TaxID=158607 RepID=A0A2P5HFG6_DIAHE|nr:hypothetical protein DHEL01_v212607 [Diaporthe helianthi]
MPLSQDDLRLDEEERGNSCAQQALRNQLSDAEKALGDSELRQKHLLASSEDTVARLKSQARELKERISELEAGVIKQDDLKAELDAARAEADELKEKTEKMEGELADMPVIEKKCAQLEEQVGALETEKADLRKDLEGKVALLDVGAAAKEAAQRLADERKTQLDQTRGELDQAQSMLTKTQDLLFETTEREYTLRDDYLTEQDLYDATLEQLKDEQDKCREMGADVERLNVIITSRGSEVTTLNETIQSMNKEIEDKDRQIQRQGAELNDLTHLLHDKKEELAEETKSLARSDADGKEARRGKENAELDLGLVLSLSIRSGDVRVQDWLPFLRSLRDSVPVRVSPDEQTLASVWAILPSWTDSSSDEESGPATFGLAPVPSSPDGLLFELFGHAMAEGDVHCNGCLRALATLSAQIGRHGLTRVSASVMVLEKLLARFQRLEAISGYHCMLLLAMTRFVALLRSLLPGTAAADGLSSIEDDLETLTERADKSLGVIRHVANALCASGDLQACEPDCFLRLNTSEGRSLLFFEEPRQQDRLFLLADPEQRTIWAVSSNRYSVDVTESNDDLVYSIVIKAPAAWHYLPDLALCDPDNKLLPLEVMDRQQSLWNVLLPDRQMDQSRISFKGTTKWQIKRRSAIPGQITWKRSQEPSLQDKINKILGLREVGGGNISMLLPSWPACLRVKIPTTAAIPMEEMMEQHCLALRSIHVIKFDAPYIPSGALPSLLRWWLCYSWQLKHRGHV